MLGPPPPSYPRQQNLFLQNQKIFPSRKLGNPVRAELQILWKKILANPALGALLCTERCCHRLLQIEITDHQIHHTKLFERCQKMKMKYKMSKVFFSKTFDCIYSVKKCPLLKRGKRCNGDICRLISLSELAFRNSAVRCCWRR